MQQQQSRCAKSDPRATEPSSRLPEKSANRILLWLPGTAIAVDNVSGDEGEGSGRRALVEERGEEPDHTDDIR
jgi:hypothetical protein